MREFSLKSLSIEGFKCFRNRTEISFSQTPGLKFLGGKNEVEPSLGANGAGKTTTWDAVFWVLYGVTAKNDKTSEIISWGAKRATGEVVLEVDGEEYKITRTGPPARTFIDGEGIEQRDLDLFLGLTADQARQSWLFGQKVRLFIDLPVAERAELLDSVMDLGLWMEASAKARKKAQEALGDAQRAEIAASEAKGALASLQSPDEARQKAEEWEAKRGGRLSGAILVVEEVEKSIAEGLSAMHKARRALEAFRGKADKNDEAIQRLSGEVSDAATDASVSRAAAQAALKQNHFHRDNATCPTCKHTMGQEEWMKSLKETAALAEDHFAIADTATERKERLQKNLDTLRQAQREEDQRKGALRSDLRTCQENVDRLDVMLNRAVAAAEEIGEEENPYQAEIARLEDRKSELQSAKRKADKAFILADGSAKVNAFWQETFKKVRVFLINRIVATLEVEIASAAASLGLPGWSIGLTTETITKSGTTKYGIKLQVRSSDSSGPWELWSGGEEQRIRLAVTHGFSNMLQRMAGVRYRFENWDEPTSGLSIEGIEDLLDNLKYRASVLNKSIWIIDHIALSYGGFAETWIATKRDDGTTLELIAKEE